MGDDRNDQFDDLFEPFELEDIDNIQATTGEHASVPPPPGQTGEQPPPRDVPHAHVTTENSPVDTVNCPACGAGNPSFNHHCERCGARLSTDPMPIAPAPAGRSTPGVRALGVLAAVVLVVALFALIMNIFRSGDEGTVTGPDTSSTTSTTSAPVIVEEVFPTSVRASSQLNDSFGPENLIDGDPETRWNDKSLRGEGAWLEFTFNPPVALAEMEFQNVTDDDKFDQNFKIQGYVITTNDLSLEVPGRLINSNEPQRVKLPSLETITLRIEITTTYPAESVGDAPPFDELALEEVRFFGVQN